VDQRQKSAVFSFAGAEIPFNVLAIKGARGQDLKRKVRDLPRFQEQILENS